MLRFIRIINNEKRGDQVGLERVPHRSLMHALGYGDEEIRKPFVGVVNSFNEIIPGHMHPVMKELSDLLRPETKTVTGWLLRENIAGAKVRSYDVIRSKDNPHSPTGGLTILFGNLAPDGAVYLSRYAERVTSASTGAVFRR